MKKQIKIKQASIVLFFIFCIFIISCNQSNTKNNNPQPNPQPNKVCPTLQNSSTNSSTNYRLTFSTNWTSSTHPTNFPSSNPHFSPLVGAVHSSNRAFWQTGSLASRGIENMAEFGGTSTLRNEIDTVSETKSYVGSNNGNTSQTSLDFSVNQDCPFVTFVSMLAPSHDWFVGVSKLDLRNSDSRFENKTINLRVYDAGTEEGDDFSFNGTTTSPANPISRLTTAASDTDFRDGVNRANGAFVAQFIFTKSNSNPTFPVRLSFESNSIQKIEPDSGNTSIKFIAKLDRIVTSPVTVSYSIDSSFDSSNDLATAGIDYIATTDANAVIPAGATLVEIPVEIIGEINAEMAEDFRIILTDIRSEADVTLDVMKKTAVVTILDNDVPPPKVCPTSQSSSTNYRLTFSTNWTSSTHPTNFPSSSNPHFSSLVGAVHSSNRTFWQTGSLASSGIENMAETGNTSTLRNEINNVSEATPYVGSNNGNTSQTSLNFSVNQDCPFVTFVSMLAPSHDWFVGVSKLDLRDTSGDFVTKTINLRVYDAGTEEGDDFSFNGATTSPAAPITRLTTATSDTDFRDGVNRANGAFVGQFIFNLLP